MTDLNRSVEGATGRPVDDLRSFEQDAVLASLAGDNGAAETPGVSVPITPSVPSLDVPAPQAKLSTKRHKIVADDDRAPASDDDSALAKAEMGSAVSDKTTAS